MIQGIMKPLRWKQPVAIKGELKITINCKRMRWDVVYYLGEKNVGSKNFLLQIYIKMIFQMDRYLVFLQIVSFKILQSPLAIIDRNLIFNM